MQWHTNVQWNFFKCALTFWDASCSLRIYWPTGSYFTQMFHFCWEFNAGVLPPASLPSHFCKQPCSAAKPRLLQPIGKVWDNLTAWAGSALLFACKHSVTRKCGVSSAPAPLNFPHPMQWVFLFCCPSCSCFSQGSRVCPSCNLCFTQSSSVVYLTSVALLTFFIFQVIQINIQNVVIVVQWQQLTTALTETAAWEGLGSQTWVQILLLLLLS